MHPKENNHPCRTLARVREYQCRLGEPTPYRFQRLEARQEGLLSSDRRLGPYTIDLFASRINAQATKYCSWRPNPTAFTVDALSISWSNHHLYLFTPFVLIPRCLAKIQKKKIPAVLIAQCGQSNVVSSVAEQLIGRTNFSSTHPKHCDEPYWPESSTGSTRSPTTSCMACFSRSSQSRGLSERVINILRKSWQPSTESSYSTAWRQWNNGVSNGKQIRLQPL